jgi:hypothetical protein
MITVTKLIENELSQTYSYSCTLRGTAWNARGRRGKCCHRLNCLITRSMQYSSMTISNTRFAFVSQYASSRVHREDNPYGARVWTAAAVYGVQTTSCGRNRSNLDTNCGYAFRTCRCAQLICKITQLRWYFTYTEMYNSKLKILPVDRSKANPSWGCSRATAHTSRADKAPR